MPLAASQLFGLLADETRLRAVTLLGTAGELCVCELVHALNTIQPKVSRHLAALRDAGVVEDRRAGQWVYYRLHPGLPDWAHAVIDAAVRAQGADPALARDSKRLTTMPDRPDRRRCA